MRFKNIKRPLAIILALFLVATVTFTTMASTTLLNGAEAENAATPKYYSAVKDWSAVNNTADSDNVFSYQFALDGSNPLWDYMSHTQWDYWYTGNTDYTNFNGLTEEEWSSKYAADTFKHATGIGPKGYMRLWNRYGDLESLGVMPAVSLAYTVKTDGFISIPAHSVSIFSSYFTKNNGYRALIRITKNGEKIYPESDYSVIDEDTQTINIEELDITVSTGDVIRFELTSDTVISKAHSIGISWNPLFYVQPEAELYTNTSDIFDGLTHFMEDVFRNKECEAMEISDSEAIALNNAKRSKYGVYTALDSVYSGGIVTSGEASVWKYGVAAIPYGFEIPTADYGLSLENTESGSILSWSDDILADIKSVLVLADGVRYTYMSQKDSASLKLPLLPEGSFVQVSCNTSASEVIEINADGIKTATGKDEPITYLKTVTNTSSGANSAYTVSDENVTSSYSLRYSFASFKSAATAQKGRTLYFNANHNEQMMLGFTAPQSGTYEISAPIVAKRDITYSILKQDIDGEFVFIDTLKSYVKDKSGYAATLNLKMGETVWLNAYTDIDTQIEIGIPRVTVKEAFADTETVTYKYRSLDYIENSYYNNKEYTTGSATEKSGRVWQFGSFENPIGSDGNNDTLGFMNYTWGNDAASLIDVLTPYELIRSGSVYNPLTIALNASGAVAGTYSFSAVGTLHPTKATAYDKNGAHRETGLPYQNKGFMIAVGLGEGKDGNTHNMGIYMKFTAPLSGEVKLNLSDWADAVTGCRILILKDKKVLAMYGTVEKGTVVNAGYMNKGESVYICYGTNSDNVYSFGGCPVAEISGERIEVNLNGNAEYSLNMLEALKMPTVSNKIGKALLGWTDSNGEYYNSGTECKFGQDISLTADEYYYGDFTGDSEINATDVAAMRINILKNEAYNLSVSDVNTDGEFDIRDIVRMKQWLAGNAVPFNVE